VAFLAGVIFDFAGTGNIGEFTIIFLLTVLIGRVVFYRKTSYASISSFVVLLLISTLLIYAWQIPLLSSDNFVGWQSFAKTFISGLVLTLAAGVIIYKIFGSYFNWYQKKTEKY
jgi:cell shape-determining protein MreD